MTHGTPRSRYRPRWRSNCRSMYSPQVSTPSTDGHMSRIWPSQKTASGWKGGCAVKAAGTSSLRHAIHEESMVMLG